MATIEQRIKRMTQTPLGSRVMLPNFGSKLFELVDKTVNEEWRLLFIKYNFECFYNTQEGELWDKEIEPEQVVFTDTTSSAINNGELNAQIKLTTGEEIIL